MRLMGWRSTTQHCSKRVAAACRMEESARNECRQQGMGVRAVSSIGATCGGERPCFRSRPALGDSTSARGRNSVPARRGRTAGPGRARHERQRGCRKQKHSAGGFHDRARSAAPRAGERSIGSRRSQVSRHSPRPSRGHGRDLRGARTCGRPRVSVRSRRRSGTRARRDRRRSRRRSRALPRISTGQKTRPAITRRMQQHRVGNDTRASSPPHGQAPGPCASSPRRKARERCTGPGHHRAQDSAWARSSARVRTRSAIRSRSEMTRAVRHAPNINEPLRSSMTTAQ